MLENNIVDAPYQPEKCKALRDGFDVLSTDYLYISLSKKDTVPITAGKLVGESIADLLTYQYDKFKSKLKTGSMRIYVYKVSLLNKQVSELQAQIKYQEATGASKVARGYENFKNDIYKSVYLTQPKVSERASYYYSATVTLNKKRRSKMPSFIISDFKFQ